KLYHGPITVGTPGQQFSVTFDTATQTSWLPSVHSPPDKRAARGFTVKNQVFGEAILEPARFADDPINDGVIGLGLSNIARKGHRTVFDNMVSQGLLPAPVFSFYLNRDNPDDRDSVLTLGGTNSEYYTGEFTFADLIVPHSWNFWLDGVQLSNGTGIYSERRYQAVVDSANAFIVGPKDVTDALNKKLGGITRPILPDI
ncbi:cathepsin d, partial [Plakobranchus ocellatus]